MNNRRRIAFGIILILFVGVCSWWCCHFSHDPDLLYAAMPARATFVSRHEDLAARFPLLIENPLVRHAILQAVTSPDMLDKILADPRALRAGEWCFGRDVVTGYVPCMPTTGEPAWVMASWIGAKMHVLRAALICGAVPGAELQDFGFGRSGWAIALGNGKRNKRRYFSLALTEGILLGCISGEKGGAGYLEARVEARSSPVPDLEYWVREIGSPGSIWRLPEPERQPWNVKDRIWCETPMTKNGAEISVFEWSPNTIKGVVRGEVTLRFSDVATDWNASLPESDAVFLGRALGEFPACLTLVPVGTVEKFLFRRASKEKLRTIGALLRNQTAEGVPGFLCLCRWEYAGHFHEFAVPSVLAGIRLKSPEAADVLLSASLEILNVGYGLGLQARRVEIEGQDITMIEWAGGNRKEGPRPGEQVAIAVKEGWMVIASNGEIMQRLARQWGDDAKSNANEWRLPLEKTRTPYWGWMDLEASALLSRKVLALYDLMKYVPQFRTRASTRRIISECKGWLEGAQAMGTASFWLVHERKWFAAGFVLGEEGSIRFPSDPRSFVPLESKVK